MTIKAQRTGIRVTVTDLETGESESHEIENDYVLVCAGSCYVAHTNVYVGKGTHVVTIKGRGSDRSGSVTDDDDGLRDAMDGRR